MSRKNWENKDICVKIVDFIVILQLSIACIAGNVYVAMIIIVIFSKNVSAKGIIFYTVHLLLFLGVQ